MPSLIDRLCSMLVNAKYEIEVYEKKIRELMYGIASVVERYTGSRGLVDVANGVVDKLAEVSNRYINALNIVINMLCYEYRIDIEQDQDMLRQLSKEIDRVAKMFS